MTEKAEVKNCPVCGHSMKQYWHKITPGLTKMLIKVHEAVWAKKENKIHLIKDFKGKSFELGPNEVNGNFTKLRFHGLVAKWRYPDGHNKGQIKRGYWLLTKRGNQFLRGDISIPAKVLTFHNKVIDHDTEQVGIYDVMSRLDLPHFEELGNIQYELGEVDIEYATPELKQGILL